MKAIRDNARQKMKKFCRVCKVCDGRVCAGEIPGMGGLGTGASFKNNVSALASLHLNMRLVHDITEPKTAITLLGYELALPVLAAPIGGVAVNMDLGVSEEDYNLSVVGGCLDAGIVGCTGDGVPPVIHEAGLAALTLHHGCGIPFIKPWEGAELDEKLEKARDTGCKAIGMDIDAAGLLTLRRRGRPVAPRTSQQLADIIGKVHAWGIAFILKGLMSPRDASLAVEAGADAVVVSNHGGRALDHTPGTATVLPEVVAAVGGRIPVLADGGVRDGGDILKMLALGADCVLIGRPVSVAAVGGGREGVARYFETLGDQLRQAMVMTGTPDVRDVSPSIIHGLNG
ncbi:alpha-hydroxy-acid oxidizing protein [Pseudodesulfovibrio cashew]|uniref:Alpha-hydroxy-acid oxidizing protein n=1 Tax=Pseudodesulfovibrio cashew TaxID=2678688 RepID=A0A6I6JI05_9BACT|nr:alpha-hydroxy-acid oxidizing protein [Pseudodesulfovibrio cashew]QGY41841.1 alpha-hydroxy-acid oxidizing protein [Pseudodesulfovibrio cashew]